MTDRMIDRMFEVSKFVGAQEAGLKRKVAALEDEVRYLRGVYADAGECFLKADAENKKLANEIADLRLRSSIDGKTIKELVAENKKLREVMRDSIGEIETGAPLTGSDILSVALGETK